MATIPPMPAADVAANVPKRRAADKPAIVTDAAMKAQRLKPTVKVVAPSTVQVIAACVWLLFMDPSGLCFLLLSFAL
jgi:hypothetical protein